MELHSNLVPVWKTALRNAELHSNLVPVWTTDEREEAVRAVTSYFLSLYTVISPSFSEAEMGRGRYRGRYSVFLVVSQCFLRL